VEVGPSTGDLEVPLGLAEMIWRRYIRGESLRTWARGSGVSGLYSDSGCVPLSKLL